MIPILPGGIGCLGGVLMFGPVMGFLYNYVGICLGSVAAFLLSKRYGQPFVRSVAGERTYEKYAGWLEKGSRFDNLFLHWRFSSRWRRTIFSAIWRG